MLGLLLLRLLFHAVHEVEAVAFDLLVRFDRAKDDLDEAAPCKVAVGDGADNLADPHYRQDLVISVID